MSNDTYSDKVSRGAMLLDRVRPGWAEEIDADCLSMETCDECVLGQLYGNYWCGLEELCKLLPHSQLYSAIDHGFTLPKGMDLGDVLPRFAALADAWRTEIYRRTIQTEETIT